NGSRLKRSVSRNQRRMDVRRIEEEVDLDFLSDAHSRTGPADVTPPNLGCSGMLNIRGRYFIVQ
ncbi:hypothetical protein Tco_0354271, partial [Tanacetum coccineum]